MELHFGSNSFYRNCLIANYKFPIEEYINSWVSLAVAALLVHLARSVARDEHGSANRSVRKDGFSAGLEGHQGCGQSLKRVASTTKSGREKQSEVDLYFAEIY